MLMAFTPQLTPRILSIHAATPNNCKPPQIPHIRYFSWVRCSRDKRGLMSVAGGGTGESGLDDERRSLLRLFLLGLLDFVWIFIAGVICWTLGWLSGTIRLSAKLYSSSCWDRPERDETRSGSADRSSDSSEISKFKPAGNISIAEQFKSKRSMTHKSRIFMATVYPIHLLSTYAIFSISNFAIDSR